MPEPLYQICPLCEGRGVLTLNNSVERDCHCRPLRVVETGLTVGQVETLSAELARARLRMSALESRERAYLESQKGG